MAHHRGKASERRPFQTGEGSEVKGGHDIGLLGTANGKAERQGSLQRFTRMGKVPDENGTAGPWEDSASRQET